MTDQTVLESPQADRPWMPKTYGVPTTQEGMLQWDQVHDQIRDALNYWIATTSAEGRPHVRPVWAAWLDNTLYFDGSPQTGWVRNIFRDPHISIQVEAGDVAIIVEGIAQDIPQADPALADRLRDAFQVKYSEKYGYNYDNDRDAWIERGLLCFRPTKILAWDVVNFGTSPTRWRFDAPNNDVEKQA